MDDKLKTCKTCGKLYRAYNVKYPLCSACLEKEELLFIDAKHYIDDNPDTTVNEVSKELEIPMRTIQKWIQEERLLFNNKKGMNVCHHCGTCIPSGNFCKNCKQSLFSTLSQQITENNKQSQNDMNSSEAKMRTKFRN